MTFTPYLNFAGTCRAAFTFYNEVFGGELQMMSMSEVPDADVPAEQADLVMHAALRVGDGMLMASDVPASDAPTPQGTYVNATLPNAEEAERVWAKLTEGAEVHMPLSPTFWSPRFGILRDRFGTLWMVNCAH